MRDGRTRKLSISDQETSSDNVLANHRFSLVVLSGASPGDEIHLGEPRTIVGRGPSVDISVPDAAMSRQHFSLELAGETFRVRDLGSTNGVVVNGKTIESADLKHGDRLKAGDHVFQFLVEQVESQPRTYIVPD